MRPVESASADERRTARALLVTCLVFYAWVITRGPDHNPDSRLALTYSLVEGGTVAIDGYGDATLDRAVRDGHFYSDKAPGVSFWLAPFYAVVRHLPLDDPGGDRFLTRYLVTLLGIGVPAALFSVWLFGWLRHLTPEVAPRALAALGWGLGSPAFPYTVHAFGHVPAAMCLFVGAVTATGLGRRQAFAGGAILGSAVAFEYTMLVPIAALLVWRARGDTRTASRRWVSVGVGLAIPLAALAGYHSVVFGAPWHTGYVYLDPAGPYAAAQAHGVSGVSWPSPGVALELLIGQKRGLLVVAPWLALSIVGAALAWRGGIPAWRTRVIEASLVFAALLAVNAGYVVWDGGASWGPRHLTPALPFVAVAALPAITRWKAFAATLVAVSIALTTAGALTGTLPPAESASTVSDFLLPALLRSGTGNTLGGVFGLHGWWGLAPLAALVGWVYASTLRPRRATGAAYDTNAATGQRARVSLDQRR